MEKKLVNGRKSMKIVDFNNAQESGLLYGGQSGLKLGITFNNENWLLKFSKNIRDYARVDLSYMTSEISECIGSHIFDILGFDVHDTLLGVRDGRLVVACKDFTNSNTQLMEYREIKNYYNQQLEEELDRSISTTEDHGSNLKAILIHSEYNPIFKKTEGLKFHFWKQSIVDILINNNDRNSGNWGVLFNRNSKTYHIAPVFDNGGSFYNKKSAKSFQKYLDNPNLLKSVSTSLQTAYKIDGHNLSIQKFLNLDEENLKNAILYVIPLIKENMGKIRNMIQEIPESYQEIHVIDQPTKDFYIKSMEIRFQEILLPRFKEICKERHLDPELMMETKAQDSQFLSEEIYNFLQSVESYNNQKVVGDCYKEWIEDDLSHGGSEIKNFIEDLKEDYNFTSNQEEVMSHILSRLNDLEKENNQDYEIIL